ncbi:hypothetical protein AAFF_G00016030 [Aldrovandia affinis]|uniref:Uncharacterized protein n=1 Tax=Aldrovandia affinis TaxID=143900 RepID=A0AAD7WGV9_9TELE|nr:hypothetical protein AAFF_G00016030 [Aldrovandia affinis]
MGDHWVSEGGSVESRDDGELSQTNPHCSVSPPGAHRVDRPSGGDKDSFFSSDCVGHRAPPLPAEVGSNRCVWVQPRVGSVSWQQNRMCIVSRRRCQS